jgi:hypothetical protein
VRTHLEANIPGSPPTKSAGQVVKLLPHELNMREDDKHKRSSENTQQG